MSKLRWLPLCFVPFLTSCLPIELDVNKDGEMIVPRQEGFFLFNPTSGKVTKVLGNDKGAPVFARFSPNGKEILSIVEKEGSFKFRVSPKTGGPLREVFSSDSATYVEYSPNGKYLAISHVASEMIAPLEDQLPELTLVRLPDGRKKRLAGNVGHLMRWFGDSKRLLVFNVKKEDKDNRYHGELAVLDVTTGKSTPIAVAIGSKNVFYDLSPDGRHALLIAYKAGKVGAKLDESDLESTMLFEVDIEKGTVRSIDREASYAIYSPDGKQALLGAPPSLQLGTFSLEVAPTDLSTFTTVAKGVANTTHGASSVDIYPGWTDNHRIHYFVNRKVYGTAGKALHLAIVSDKGLDKQWLQLKLDAKALEFAK